MFDSDNLLDSVGGSLLNDLLSDLNAAVDAANKDTNRAQSSSNDDGGDDDLFALLEQELTSTYNVVDPSTSLPGGAASSSSTSGPPPGMMGMSSAAAFVVNQQQEQANINIQLPATVSSGGGGGNDDAWSTALSQFGGMSLAADFLAADATAKKEQPVALAPAEAAGPPGVLPADKLFEEDDYVLEEEAKLDETETTGGGLAALLGAATSRGGTAASATKPAKESELTEETVEVKTSRTEAQMQPTLQEQRSMPIPPPGHGPPPPGPMFPPPHHMMMPPPPGAMMPGMIPPMMMPPGMPPGMMPPPPHPMMVNPAAMMPPQPMPPHMGGELPPPPQHQQQTPQDGAGLSNKDFPALGSTPDDAADDETSEEKVDDSPNIMPPRPVVEAPRAYFNNTNPAAPPIDSKRIATKLMPSRDVSFIVHMMLRPLQSLDTYNDDYYHFSMVQRRSAAIMAAPQGGPAGGMIPVSKDVKAIAHQSETKFQEAIKTRARTFAEEKKSLGQMVKTNVKRPKALLTTPVMNKDNVDKDETEQSTDGGKAPDAKYETEQRRNRISVWKARVSIDRGYSAFLSLIELRRLIQANAGSSPQLINELMGDVKTNVDRMHSSLGVMIKVQQGSKKIEVDESRLASTLSLPKGRVLCARVIEDGILPHPSACHILPLVLTCILSWPIATPTNSNEGEDRLLHALTGLVRTPQPSVDPLILLRCLDELTALGANNVSAITGGRMRMELVHAILSVGKNGCASGPMEKGWLEKEKAFLEVLKGAQK